MISLSSNLNRRILEGFLETSMVVVEKIVGELDKFKREKGRKIRLFYFKDNKMRKIEFHGEQFFLRSSVEYSNPQLTVEEVQGIIAARLIEVCGNYFDVYDSKKVTKGDVKEL